MMSVEYDFSQVRHQPDVVSVAYKFLELQSTIIAVEHNSNCSQPKVQVDMILGADLDGKHDLCTWGTTDKVWKIE